MVRKDSVISVIFFSLYHFNLSYNHFIWSWPSSLRVIKAINLAALDSIIFWIDLGLSWSVGYENIRNQYSFSFTYAHIYIHPLSSIKTNPDCVKWVIHWSILSIHKWKIILLPSCAYYVFDLKRKVWLKSILKCSWMFDLAHNFQVQWCSSGLIIGPWLYHTEMKSAFIFHQLIFLKSKDY